MCSNFLPQQLGFFKQVSWHFGAALIIFDCFHTLPISPDLNNAKMLTLKVSQHQLNFPWDHQTLWWNIWLIDWSLIELPKCFKCFFEGNFLSNSGLVYTIGHVKPVVLPRLSSENLVSILKCFPGCWKKVKLFIQWLVWSYKTGQEKITNL